MLFIYDFIYGVLCIFEFK